MNKKFVACLLIPFLCLRCGSSNVGIAGHEPSSMQEEKALSLEECVRAAIENSFEIRLARLDFLIAESDLTIAEAVFDASLFGNIGYERDKREPLSVFGSNLTRTGTYSAGISKELPSGADVTLSFSNEREWTDSGYVSRNPAYTTEAAIEIRQPLAKNAFGYIDRAGVSAARLAIQNTDLDTKERVESLLAEVEKAYWEWAFAKRNIEIHREMLERAKELHKSNTRNYDLGLIEKGDFLASSANVIMQEKEILIADNTYRRAEENIKLLMNIDASLRICPQEPLGHISEKFDLSDCLKKAFALRRDYQKAKTELERQKIILRTKANEKWPQIDLIASMAANGINSQFNKALDRIGTGNADYYMGLEVSIPLENNSAAGEFNKVLHNKEKTIIELKEIERRIVTEIGNLFRDYAVYEVNMASLRQVTELHGEKLREEEKRFAYGRSTTKTLIDYQEDYLNAESQLARQTLDAQKAKINLDKALNVILEKYEGLL